MKKKELGIRFWDKKVYRKRTHSKDEKDGKDKSVART